MKKIPYLPALLLTLLLLGRFSSMAQAIDPNKSARAEVMSDARFIDSSIEYNEDIIFLSQKALERATDSRLKELAQQILEDNSGMLYTMQQLQTAGSGTTKRTIANNPNRKGGIVNARLSKVSGQEYDTLWVSEVLGMHQNRYDQLVNNKETVRNPQLKMAITEAVSPLRKSLTQLKALQRYFIKLAIQQKKEEAARQKEAKGSKP